MLSDALSSGDDFLSDARSDDGATLSDEQSSSGKTPVLRARDGSDDASLSSGDMAIDANVHEPILSFEHVIDYSTDSEFDAFSEDDLFNSVTSCVSGDTGGQNQSAHLASS